MKISGYSRQQLTRLISEFTRESCITRKQCTANGFQNYYTQADIGLLAKLDELHDKPNGLRIKKLCERAHLQFRHGSKKLYFA